MRVATVTTFFPRSTDRHRAVFVENLVRAMIRNCPVDVISPIPFALPLRAVPEWHRMAQTPRVETIDGIDVAHPRFIVVPKLEMVSGLTYAAAVTNPLRRLGAAASDLVVHAHCAYPDGVGVALAARRLKLPYVVTAHGSDMNVYAEYKSLGWQIRWALAGAAAVIAVSAPLRAKVLRLLGPGAGESVFHIPCAGFDEARFFPRARAQALHDLGLPPGGRLAVFVGMLVPIKNVDKLVDAWALLHGQGRVGPNDRLVLIGEGKERADLERRAAAGGVADRIVFAGGLPQQKVAQWIGASDLLCLPSRNEGTPNVVVEALASGVPVVASRVGGIPDLVSDGSNGLLVPPGDVPALAQAIAASLSRSWDPEHVRKSVAHLTWDRIAASTIDCLRDVVRRGQPAAVA